MRKSWRITQSAVTASLGTMVLFLGHSLQFGEFFWYLIATALLLLVLSQTGYLGGFVAYVAMIALTFFLTGDLFYLIPFAILGLIPFVETFFHQIHIGKIPTFVFGMLLFDAAIVSTFVIFENRLLAYFPDLLETLYPTSRHWVLYLAYGAEAFIIGIPSYLAFSFGLARANLKLHFLLKADQRSQKNSITREEKRRQRIEKRQEKISRKKHSIM